MRWVQLSLGTAEAAGQMDVQQTYVVNGTDSTEAWWKGVCEVMA